MVNNQGSGFDDFCWIRYFFHRIRIWILPATTDIYKHHLEQNINHSSLKLWFIKSNFMSALYIDIFFNFELRSNPELDPDPGRKILDPHAWNIDKYVVQ